MRTFSIFLLATWSGFYVMAIELLSSRILAPEFGNSIYVWGAIITVFMLALSAGYLAGGFCSARQPRVWKLGALLIVQALSTVVAIRIGEPVLSWVFATVDDVRYGSLLSAAILFFIPTAISGMVSPYAVSLLVREARLSGHYAGLLYFASTFGSAAGTILTSFHLVLVFELDQIFYGLASISVALGLLGCATSYREKAGV